MRLNYFNKPITKRFIDAFPQFEAEAGDDTHYFWETWVDCPFYTDKLTKDDLKDIYYHLLAKFYDWHFIYKDDLGIMLNIMHTIEEYYPNVKENINIVAQVMDMNDALQVYVNSFMERIKFAAIVNSIWDLGIYPEPLLMPQLTGGNGMQDAEADESENDSQAQGGTADEA